MNAVRRRLKRIRGSGEQTISNEDPGHINMAAMSARCFGAFVGLRNLSPSVLNRAKYRERVLSTPVCALLLCSFFFFFLFSNLAGNLLCFCMCVASVAEVVGIFFLSVPTSVIVVEKCLHIFGMPNIWAWNIMFSYQGLLQIVCIPG